MTGAPSPPAHNLPCITISREGGLTANTASSSAGLHGTAGGHPRHQPQRDHPVPACSLHGITPGDARATGRYHPTASQPLCQGRKGGREPSANHAANLDTGTQEPRLRSARMLPAWHRAQHGSAAASPPAPRSPRRHPCESHLSRSCLTENQWRASQLITPGAN